MSDSRRRLGILFILCAGACSHGTLTELQRVRSGNVDVLVLSDHDGVRHGTDTFVVEFRSAGDLVDAGDVRATATMAMPGSAPMFGAIDLTRTEKGRYRAESQFAMAGAWRTTIEWNGPAGQGSITFSAAVQ